MLIVTLKVSGGILLIELCSRNKSFSECKFEKTVDGSEVIRLLSSSLIKDTILIN